MQMKKRLTILLSTALMATAITGCNTTQATATTAQTDTTVATYAQGNLSADKLNTRLMEKAGMQGLLDLVDKDILDTVQPVTDEMKSAADAQLQQIKDYYKDDFEASLKINGFSSEETFKDSLLLGEQRNAYTFEYVKKEHISEEDITAYYDNFSPEIEASHILLKPADESESAKSAALSQAQDLIKRINAGEDFAELAKEFSADPGSGSQGGSLGSFGKGMMVKEFEEAAFALAIDEVTQEPVESQFGFHIIKKTGGSEKKSLEDMKAEILQTLAESKIQSDNSLSFKALIQLRTDNQLKISTPLVAEQYDLFTKQVNK